VLALLDSQSLAPRRSLCFRQTLTGLRRFADYRETAAKFQKEWHIQAPPHRHFEFAPHVKNHALVTVLNHGLVYLALEREYAQSQVCLTAPLTRERARLRRLLPFFAVSSEMGRDETCWLDPPLQPRAVGQRH